jgi:hypothetical protein
MMFFNNKSNDKYLVNKTLTMDWVRRRGLLIILKNNIKVFSSEDIVINVPI